tara:strand:- start:9949 stop:10785 length:837 start_codon:yes stop_codon:yes gene_type:complete
MDNKKEDFAVFILTHGRPNNVITKKTLDRCGYTGKIFYVIDNEDKTIDEYIKNFGIENVKIFDKKTMADKIDEGNNFDERRTITHARNACFEIAKELDIKYFIELDDDYYYFGYRGEKGAVKISNINKVFKTFVEFLKNSKCKTIAFSQGGDHIGGFSGLKLKRKAMNSFICSTDNDFRFIGSMNEDVNTYTTLSSRGFLFFTFTGVQLDQKDTQSQNSGITDMYLLYGTYCKSFTTVMMMPSSVKVSMMNSRTSPRLHHSIKWKNTTPMIIDDRYKK